jgi:60 kDa SS-A/Ro ribonucleoprotein
MPRYASIFTATPQTRPIPGRADMARNDAGGYGWRTEPWKQLDRFLILGVEGNTYYCRQQDLTVDNVQNVIHCLQQDEAAFIEHVAALSESGRAPKNDAAIFALALALSPKYSSQVGRRLALAAVPRVCRTGTHILHLANELNTLRGWGKTARAAIAAWFEAQTPGALSYQLVKYRQRDGWTFKDLLRLAHLAPKHELAAAQFHWLAKGWEGSAVEKMQSDPALQLIAGYEKARGAASEIEVICIINDYRLPWEALDSRWLSSPGVWATLLPTLPIGATLRNLARMTANGLFADSDMATIIAARLTDSERLRRGRLHPMAILTALKTYEQGHGERGKLTWAPVKRIVEALNAAFYLAFQNVEPSHASLLLALDISSSMQSGTVAGSPSLTPALASAAMALVTARTEPNALFVGFGNPSIVPLHINRDWSLAQTLRAISGLDFGGTDCSLPMVYAMAQRLHVDSFIIYTDNETWAGRSHPAQALATYRKQLEVPNAKLVTVAMTAEQFTIADPNDPGMLDVVGFDAAAPALISDYTANRLFDGGQRLAEE